VRTRPAIGSGNVTARRVPRRDPGTRDHQARAFVSVTPASYQRLRAYCDAQGLSMDAVIQALVPDVRGEP